MEIWAKPQLRVLLDHLARIKDTRQSWKPCARRQRRRLPTETAPAVRPCWVPGLLTLAQERSLDSPGIQR